MKPFIVSTLLGLIAPASAWADPVECALSNPQPSTRDSALARLFLGPEVEERLNVSQPRLSVVVKRPLLVPQPDKDRLEQIVEMVFETAVGKLGLATELRSLTIDLTALSPGVTLQMTGPAAAHIALPAGLDGPQLDADLGHQLGHALLGPQPALPSWWSEAFVVWLTDRAGLGSGVVEQAVAATASRPERSPLVSLDSGVCFAGYLAERFGAGFLADVWQQLGVGSEREPLLVVARLLEERGLGFGQELESYAAWLYVRSVENKRDISAWEVDALPQRVEVRERVPGPLGVSFVQVYPAGLVDGVKLTFSGDGRSEWLLAVMAASSELPQERSSLSVSREGRAQGSVPARDARVITLAVINASQRAIDGLAFAVDIDVLDEYPFILGEIELEAVPEGLRLVWTTGDERDVYGWRVLRAGMDGQELSALGTVLMPAAGAGATYSVLDTSAEAGRT